MTAADAAHLSLRVLAVGLVLAAVEQLVCHADLRRGGLLDWRILVLARRGWPTLPGWAHALWTFGVPPALIACTVYMFVAPDSVAGLLVLSLYLVMRLRVFLALDGADGMTVLVLSANALRLTDVAAATPAYVGFVATAAVLAYATSGFAKLRGREWLYGLGLPRTLSTRMYGTPSTARLLRSPAIGRLSSWATIALEVGFVLTPVLPRPALVALLALMLFFHVSCAFVMALGSFVWAFGATYPCIIAAASTFSVPVEVRLGGTAFVVLVVALQIFATIDQGRTSRAGARRIDTRRVEPATGGAGRQMLRPASRSVELENRDHRSEPMRIDEGSRQ